MIVCAGVVGVCLTLGGLKHRYQDIKRQGTNASLAVIMALTVLALILPNYTDATSPGTFSASQLAFVSVLSILLYGAFVFAQMVRHRGDFIEDLTSSAEHEAHVSEGGKSDHQRAPFICRTGRDRSSDRAGGRQHREWLKFLQVTQADAIVGFFVAALVLMPEAGARGSGQRSITSFSEG